MTIDPRLRFRLETTVFFIAMLGFCALATQGQWFRTLDYALYDALVRTFPLPLREDIVIVGIDEQSLSSYGSWPWPRNLQGDLIRAVNAAGPRAVLVDFVYGGTSSPPADEALAAAGADVSVLALPMMVDALTTGRQLVEVLPYPDLLDTADVLGHVHVELDADASARGVYLYQGVGEARWPHLALALAVHLYPTTLEAQSCAAEYEFSLQNQRCGFVYLPFAGPPGTHAEISASDLLEGRAPVQFLRDKVVFIGITTIGAPDSITSPVSANDRPMSGVEFNANLFSALLQDRTVSGTGMETRLGLALACVVLPVLLLPRLKAKAMLVSAAAFTVLPVAMTVTAFTAFGAHLPLAAAAVTCFLSYPYWSWRRIEVAWQFVNTEFERLELEKPRWVFAGQARPRDGDLERIEALLDANAVWYDASPSIAHDRQVTCDAPDGRCLVLTRSTPFSPAEQALAQRLMAAHVGTDAAEGKLPGEMLAAQIRRLQTAAEEVRVGRDVGLRGLAEMPNGVAVLSALNRVLFVNQACRQLLGLTGDASEMDITHLTQGLVPPLGTSWRELRRGVVLDHEIFSFEATTRAGTPVVVDGAPLAEAGQVTETWVLTITDMTDVRAAERDREEALAFLSHDLRSPMLSVLALLRGGYSPELAPEIERYTQKALSVSEQFVQLSRVQAREQFEVYELDLETVIDNAVDQVYPMAREKGCEVRVAPSGLDDGAWLVGNGELLERAMVNLLGNAIKYSSSAAPIDVTLTASAKTFTVEVADQGIGIPAEEVGSVFEPYFRSQNPALAAQRGTGLGLRFVKTVVERHGGTVGVASELGRGSRFTVTLPRPAGDEAA